MPTPIKKDDYVKIIRKDLVGKRGITEENFKGIHLVVSKKTNRYNLTQHLKLEDVGFHWTRIETTDVIKVNTKLYELRKKLVEGKK